MENEVTIIYNDTNIQPTIISDCYSIEVKRDNILLIGRGYKSLFFKDKVRSMTIGREVKVYVK